MWFRRRDIGYAKSLRTKWTHEGPSTKRKKWWAHEGSRIEKKRNSHVLKIKTKESERSFMLKEYSFSSSFFPHTCTTWSKSMALLYLDPWFDFTTYAIQVCYIVYPYLKLHINLFRSKRKRKKAKHCYALVGMYTPLSVLRVPFEE
jgi:hypothetical protein